MKTGWLRRARDDSDDYPPIEPAASVEGWNTACPQFAFAICREWRAMTAQEALAQGSGQHPVLAGAQSQRANALLSVICAMRIGDGDIEEAIHWPERMVAARQKGDAQLVAGPERLRVGSGRALQLQFDETVPGEPYGLSERILQRRVETVFEGAGQTWMLQLIAPLEAYAADFAVYRTALGTWRWDHP